MTGTVAGDTLPGSVEDLAHLVARPEQGRSRRLDEVRDGASRWDLATQLQTGERIDKEQPR